MDKDLQPLAEKQSNRMKGCTAPFVLITFAVDEATNTARNIITTNMPSKDAISAVLGTVHARVVDWVAEDKAKLQ